jgi:hypothetical protein
MSENRLHCACEFYTHAPETGDRRPPRAKPSDWRAARRARTSSVFPPEDHSAPNKGIGKEWQNPREKRGLCPFWPPFGALCRNRLQSLAPF